MLTISAPSPKRPITLAAQIADRQSMVSPQFLFSDSIAAIAGSRHVLVFDGLAALGCADLAIRRIVHSLITEALDLRQGADGLLVIALGSDTDAVFEVAQAIDAGIKTLSITAEDQSQSQLSDEQLVIPGPYMPSFSGHDKTRIYKLMADREKGFVYLTGGTSAELELHEAALGAAVTTRSWWSDAHFHPTNYVQQGLDYRDMLAKMDAAGVRYSVISPIPTDVIPCGHANHNEDYPAENYYIPKSLRDLKPADLTQEIEDLIVGSALLRINHQVDADTTLFLKLARLTDAQRARLFPMVTGLDLGSPLNVQALLFKLAGNPGVFCGLGEITLHKELVDRQYDGKRAANLADNDQCLRNLVETAGIIGMPVVLHCDVNSTGNLRGALTETPVYLNLIKRLFRSRQFVDTVVIWAHAGGLGRFVTETAGHVNSLREILACPEMRHIHIDISWLMVAQQLVKPQAIDAWAELIDDFPERFLFGSDALAPDSSEMWCTTYNTYAPLFEKLDTATLSLLRNENFNRIFSRARTEIRRFESEVLTDAFVTECLRTPAPQHRPNASPFLNPAAIRHARDRAYRIRPTAAPHQRDAAAKTNQQAAL